jgi:hypothetical protein
MNTVTDMNTLTDMDTVTDMDMDTNVDTDMDMADMDTDTRNGHRISQVYVLSRPRRNKIKFVYKYVLFSNGLDVVFLKFSSKLAQISVFLKFCDIFAIRQNFANFLEMRFRENFVKSAAKTLAKFGIDFAKISYIAKSDIIISCPP